jgi:hypothetical protein
MIICGIKSLNRIITYVRNRHIAGNWERDIKRFLNEMLQALPSILKTYILIISTKQVLLFSFSVSLISMFSTLSFYKFFVYAVLFYYIVVTYGGI